MALSDVEISALRSEIVQHTSQILDVTKIAITAAIAVIGFGISRPAPQSGLISLLPLLILWPSFSVVMNRRMNVVRIATYLRAFGGSSFQYEKLLREFRKYNKNKKWPSFHRAIMATFEIPGYISIIFSFVLLIVGQEWYYLTAPVIASIVWIVFVFKVRKSAPLLGSKAEDEMFESWLEAAGEAEKQRTTKE